MVKIENDIGDDYDIDGNSITVMQFKVGIESCLFDNAHCMQYIYII